MKDTGLQGLEKNASFGTLAGRIGSTLGSGASKALQTTGKKVGEYTSRGGLGTLKNDIGKGLRTVGDKVSALNGKSVSNGIEKMKNTFNSYKGTLNAKAGNVGAKPASGLQTLPQKLTNFSTSAPK